MKNLEDLGVVAWTLLKVTLWLLFMAMAVGFVAGLCWGLAEQVFSIGRMIFS